MATIRTLVTKLVLDSRSALNGLKAYDRAWKVVAKSVESSAAVVEKAAARAMSALDGVAGVAAAARGAAAGMGGGGGGGSRGPRPARTSNPEIDKIVREGQREVARQERERARQAKQAARDGARRAGAHERGERGAGIAAARFAGLAAGGVAVTDATRALGTFATASDRAKAKVVDLTAQVARNRKEMADLREQALRTGDADGTLAGKMQGLSVKTLQVGNSLAQARRELRAVDGGLIDAVKNATNLSQRFGALQVAAGNLISGLVSRGFRMVTGSIAEAAESAMKFETALVDVAKVAQDADLTKEGLLDPRVKQGIKDVSKELGVMPTEVAELTAQITAAFSGKTDIVALASDVTKIGVAWDITGKQAGEYFKQTSAGLQLNADETKALFGSINELGNKLGVKSSEIAEAMTRSAGVLKGANISGETGAALNATLIKAGASAEVAATGVRTFVARLGAGEAATDKQRMAFDALGLSAEKVAKNLSSGDAAKAEAQIQEVVGALVKMGEVAPDKRMATLIELFGSESIGSIGAAASAVDTLASSFAIAGDKVAALASVQTEYDRVSDTSAKRVAKLKANIGVLAIELGDKLLPYVDRVVAFLMSPEGQDWGAQAVEKVVGLVTGLAEIVSVMVGGFSSLTDALGGTTTALGLMAAAVGILLGPWGLLLTGAVALGSYLGGPFLENMEKARASELLMAKSIVDGGKAMQEFTADIQRRDGVFAKLSDRWREVMLRIMGATDALNEFHRRQDAEEVRAGKLAHEEARSREVDRQRSEQAKRTIAAGEADAARRRAEATPGGGSDVDTAGLLTRKGRADITGLAEGDRELLFERLAAKRAAGQPLKPSESKVLAALSKALDRPLPKAGGGKGRHHKQTKMDLQLAAMDPALAGILTQGGEEDAGGDMKVHDDLLSRGAFKAAAGKHGLGALDRGSGGIGPGPNITNTYNNTTVTVQQAIDARSTASVPENIRSAARDAGNQVAGVVITGVQRARALQNAGGRMVPA